MAEIAANRARSKEGHAAMSMKGGQNDRWVEIQRNTFTNWVNEQLRQVDTSIEDLQTDLCDGVKLCRLVEVLREERIARVINKPFNQHQSLENVTLALHAVSDDNVRLVNIGNEDIVNSNLKLIMGLIWHLILRYQIGKTKFPAKRLMLAWLRAVIPECNITNFTTNWNDGVALHALIDYCEPGLCPNWRTLDRSDRLNNCRDAMTLAKQHFDIPLVLRPEDLSSDDLDDLSGMTYLSYYMKVDSPGYNATMKGVRNILKNGDITNFTIDWADGQVLRNIVRSLGENMPDATGDHVTDIQNGLEGGRKLAVEPLLSAKDFAETAETEEDHIGIMAYAAYFTRLTPVRSSGEKLVLESQPKDSYVGNECSFRVQLEDPNVSPNDVRAEVIGPDSTHSVKFEWLGRTAEGSFTPIETGHHKLNVFCENEAITGSPVSFKVSADRSKVTLLPIDACAVGTMTELKVNSAGAGQGDVRIEARAPSGHTLNLPAVFRNDVYVANFTPTEVGDYDIIASYDGEPVGSGQQTVHSFDPSAVKIHGLEGGSVGSAVIFHADIQNAGRGVLRCDVAYQGNQIPSYIAVESSGEHSVEFTPQGAGIYNVHVFYNDIEVRGSPYDVDIVDSNMVSVSGNGLTLVPVNKTASFNVNTSGGSGKVDVDITAPSSKSLMANIHQQNNSTHVVEFLPTEAGDHRIQVYYCGQMVKGSPFICKAFDTDLVMVSNMPPHATLGERITFDIDASKAGSGNIEIMVNEGQTACSVQGQGNYRFSASFVPENKELHIIEMKFNAIQVKGSPWTVKIRDTSDIQLTGNGLTAAHIKQKSSFFIHSSHGHQKDLLSIFIKGPNGRSVPSNITQTGYGQEVEYIPTDVGDHQIEVKYDGRYVEGSPCVAKTYDTSAINVTELRSTIVGNSVEFFIDVSRAGEGQLEIMVNDGTLPNTVDSETPGVYRITFVPEQPGKQYVEIHFNRESVPGSPFTCSAVDTAGTSVRGMPSNVPIHKMSSFIIHTEGEMDADLAVVDIYSPAGRAIPVRKPKLFTRDGCHFEFTPQEAGTYTVNTTIEGIHIRGSPFYVKCWDSSMVKVSRLPTGIQGTPCKFTIDASEAGEGRLEIQIMSNGITIPNKLSALGQNKYEVIFTGHDIVDHKAFITFNGEPIPGSPFFIHFPRVEKIIMDLIGHVHFIPCHRIAGIMLLAAPGLLGKLTSHVIAADGSKVASEIRDSGSGSYSVEFLPEQIGDHLVNIVYAGVPISGSPFTVKTFNPDLVSVDINSKAVRGEPCILNMDMSEAGEGKLEMIVRHNGISVESAVREAGQSQVEASFIPQDAGDYEIDLRYNDEIVKGSPFLVGVEDDVETVVHTQQFDYIEKTDTSRARSVRTQPIAVSIQKEQVFKTRESQWFLIQGGGEDIAVENLDIVIRAPNAEHIHSEIQPQTDGNYKVEWTPLNAGRHTVEVQYAGSPVDGSPYGIDVFDLSAIHVDGLRKGAVGEEAGFNVEYLPWSVDFSSTGSMQNQIHIVSPSGKGLDYDIHDIGHLKKQITYIPEESGTHEIFITYGGYDLPGCPYIQHIDDGGSVVAQGDGLYHGEEDKPAVFYVDTGRRKGNLEVKVDGPNSVPKYSMEPQSDGSYTVTYIPVEVGLFDLSVIWNGKEIQGSPFHPRVVDPRKVRVIDGWHHYLDSKDRITLSVHEEKQLPFDVSEAGPGNLRAEVSGPSQSIPVTVDDHTFGKATIIFTPEEEGNHYIHIFWGNIPIVESPFRGFAAGVRDNKVVLTGRGLKEAVVREKAEFVIDGSNAGQGEPQVTLQGFKAEVEVNTLPLGAGRFRCNYIPSVPGAYLLHIQWNGRQLRGSPYKVNVTGAFYHNKVVVTGEGLRGAALGRDMDVHIDTRKAGPGELTASCMGPHKAGYCELEDHQDGTFRLSIKPQEPGKHLLQIKYGGEHVIGSPYIVRVSQQPDASKVRVTGPGVEHGILATFQSRFIVETRGAGAGQLTVRIRGPKGAFQVEMYRDSQRDRTILCRYDPTETGLYIINVKWSGVDVPGSAFHVQIVDTQQELEQVLQDASFSGSPLSSPRTKVYNQWREDM